VEPVLDAQLLATELSTRARNGAMTFGIDGVDGTDRTRLAKQVAALLGWTLVHLDDYVASDKGTYFDNLDMERLSRDIVFAPRPFLVEGVCVLGLTSRLHLAVDILVYVRRLSSSGEWMDEDQCLLDCSAEDRIRGLERGMGRMTELRKEVIAYRTTGPQKLQSSSSMLCEPPNKQLQRTLMRHRGDLWETTERFHAEYL
jgi:hypothetical protein